MQSDEPPSERYRRLARECLEMARTTATSDTRPTLIEMAQVWLRLAEEQDAPTPSRMVEQARPVVQQQQQDQPVVQQQQQVQPKADEKKD